MEYMLNHSILFDKETEITCNSIDKNTMVIEYKNFAGSKSKPDIKIFKIDFESCKVYENGKVICHVDDKAFMKEVHDYLLGQEAIYHLCKFKYLMDDCDIRELYMAKTILRNLAWAFIMWVHKKEVPVLGK